MMIKHLTKTDKDRLEYQHHGEQNRVGLNQERGFRQTTLICLFHHTRSRQCVMFFNEIEVLKMAPSTAALPPPPPSKIHPTFCFCPLFSEP